VNPQRQTPRGLAEASASQILSTPLRVEPQGGGVGLLHWHGRSSDDLYSPPEVEDDQTLVRSRWTPSLSTRQAWRCCWALFYRETLLPCTGHHRKKNALILAPISLTSKAKMTFRTSFSFALAWSFMFFRGRFGMQEVRGKGCYPCCPTQVPEPLRCQHHCLFCIR
jgi:hypothetical protein